MYIWKKNERDSLTSRYKTTLDRLTYRWNQLILYKNIFLLRPKYVGVCRWVEVNVLDIVESEFVVALLCSISERHELRYPLQLWVK